MSRWPICLTRSLSAYPNQDALLKSKEKAFTPEQREAYVKKLREVGRTRGVDETLNRYNIDVIIGPAESNLAEVAAASGTHLSFSN